MLDVVRSRQAVPQEYLRHKAGLLGMGTLGFAAAVLAGLPFVASAGDDVVGCAVSIRFVVGVGCAFNKALMRIPVVLPGDDLNGGINRQHFGFVQHIGSQDDTIGGHHKFGIEQPSQRLHYGGHQVGAASHGFGQDDVGPLRGRHRETRDTQLVTSRAVRARVSAAAGEAVAPVHGARVVVVAHQRLAHAGRVGVAGVAPGARVAVVAFHGRASALASHAPVMSSTTYAAMAPKTKMKSAAVAFVQAIQNNRASEFSLFYRQIDLLIVDEAPELLRAFAADGVADACCGDRLRNRRRLHGCVAAA